MVAVHRHGAAGRVLGTIVRGHVAMWEGQIDNARMASRFGLLPHCKKAIA